MKTVTGVPAYDEMYAGDAARAPQAELHSVLARLSPEELHDRARLRDAYLDRNGITFTLGERERPLRNRLKTVETKLEKVSKELVALDLRLADPSLYASDKAEIQKLVQAQGKLRGERDALEEEWLTVQDALG